MRDRRLTAHSPWRDWLPEYIAGSLPVEHQAAFEVHLETCVECRQNADYWKQIASAIRLLERSEPIDRLSTADRARLIRHVTDSDRKSQMTTSPFLPKTRFVRPLSMISLATFALLVVVISTIFHRPPTFESGGIQPPIALQVAVSATSSPIGTKESSETPSTATIVPTPTPNITGTMFARKLSGLPLPAPGEAATMFGPQTIALTLNQPVGDELMSNHSQSLYTFTPSQDGLLEVGVVSFDFTPLIRFYYLDSNPITYQDSPVYDSTTNYDGSALYTHVHKGQRIGLSISSKDSKPGQFTVYPNMRQGTTLIDSRPLAQTFTVQVGQVSLFDKGYYSFDAKVGDLLDVRVKSFDHNDYFLYLEGYTDDYAGTPIFYPTFGQRCVDLLQAQQCSDDDSGGDTDPELHDVFVRQDRHFDVVVSAVGTIQQPFNYQITLTRTPPITFAYGNVVASLLSAKRTVIAYVINDVHKDETIPLLFTRDYGSKIPINLTATQNGQFVRGITNNGEPSSAFTLYSTSTDPILIIVQYVGAIDKPDEMTNFSLEWPRQQ